MSRVLLGPREDTAASGAHQTCHHWSRPCGGMVRTGGTESSDFPLTGARAPFHNVYKGNSHDE